MFDGFWRCNADTNKGKDPGPPVPIVPYKDRMGAARDELLIKLRNEDGTPCEGTLEAHQQGVKASLRETSQDVVARDKGDEKEAERRQKSVMSLNKKTKDKKATNPGSDTEVSSQKPASVRNDNSDITKARTSSLKKEKTNENQDALPKSTGSPAPRAKGHKGRTRSADPSPNDDQQGKKGQ